MYCNYITWELIPSGSNTFISRGIDPMLTFSKSILTVDQSKMFNGLVQLYGKRFIYLVTNDIW